MAVFIYRAVTKNGQIVRNRVDELSRFTLMKKLKENELLPISVIPVRTRLSSRNVKVKKKNIETSTSILKSVREQEFLKKRRFKKNRISRQNVRCNAIE